MKTLIIYNSKYGFTKKYANWLAEELNADLCDGKNLKEVKFNDYSTIIFGSSLYSGNCKCAALLVKHFEKIKDKKVILFTCGLMDITKESNIIEINKALDKVISPEIRNKIKIFHLRGGVNYDSLNFIHKMMMKMVYSMASKKSDNELTDMERDVMESYGQQVDFSDRDALKPIFANI